MSTEPQKGMQDGYIQGWKRKNLDYLINNLLEGLLKTDQLQA